MSSAVIPLTLSSLAAAITSIFPAFVTFRFYRLHKESPLPRQEIYIQVLTVACLTFLHFNEVLKSAYFGLEYSQNDTSSPMRQTIGQAINFFTEAGHISVVLVVLARMSSLVAIQATSVEFGQAGRERDIHFLVSIGLAFVRCAMPLLARAMNAKASAFGYYPFLALGAEIVVFVYATFVTTRYLKSVQQEDGLSIPGWILFSNPIATGALTAVSSVSFLVLVFTFVPQYETSMATIANKTIPLVLWSFYAVLVGSILVLYQDTKGLINESKIKASNISPRRMKFTADLI